MVVGTGGPAATGTCGATAVAETEVGGGGLDGGLDGGGRGGS
jgi:hypothetical protein